MSSYRSKGSNSANSQSANPNFGSLPAGSCFNNRKFNYKQGIFEQFIDLPGSTVPEI